MNQSNVLTNDPNQFELFQAILVAKYREQAQMHMEFLDVEILSDITIDSYIVGVMIVIHNSY